MFTKGERSREKITAILLRGFEILRKHDLKPFLGTRWVQLQLQGLDEKAAVQICHKEGLISDESDFAAWDQWRLIIDDKEYRSPFRNLEEWAAHYANR